MSIFQHVLYIWCVYSTCLECKNIEHLTNYVN
uniref:Uncharacterized protein n=1 Tax=Rhizophora mucronata TaxID=61149 RepID=A0A2P2R332_RHIMU